MVPGNFYPRVADSFKINRGSIISCQDGDENNDSNIFFKIKACKSADA